VRSCLARGCSLASIGVRWVLVERDQPGEVSARALTGTRPVYTGKSLVLHEAETSVRTRPSEPVWRVALLVVAYVVAAGSLFVNGVTWSLRRVRTDW